MPPESDRSAEEPLAGLTHEERASAAARAVEQVATTLAAEWPAHTAGCNKLK